MKNKKFNVSLVKIVSAALLAFASISVNAQVTSLTWDYPVKPGTEEWKTFTTHQQMVTACQMPEEVLSSMSTPDLLEACLNYPLFGDVHFQEHITEGVPILVSSFNGMSELLGRKDCPEVLIDLYKKEHLPEVLPKESFEYFRMFYIELLIGTSGILERLDGDSRITLMGITLSKIKEKRGRDYYVYYQSGSAIILSRALSLAGLDVDIKENPVLNTFNETGTILDLSLIGEIETLTVKYLESHE